jgi:hypothetical protein
MLPAMSWRYRCENGGVAKWDKRETPRIWLKSVLPHPARKEGGLCAPWATLFLAGFGVTTCRARMRGNCPAVKTKWRALGLGGSWRGCSSRLKIVRSKATVFWKKLWLVVYYTILYNPFRPVPPVSSWPRGQSPRPVARERDESMWQSVAGWSR